MDIMHPNDRERMRLRELQATARRERDPVRRAMLNGELERTFALRKGQRVPGKGKRPTVRVRRHPNMPNLRG